MEKTRKPTVLLFGSYNGQDSLGDKELLRIAVRKFIALGGRDLRLVGHIERNLECGKQVAPEVEFHYGIAALLTPWLNKFRYLRVPYKMQLQIAVLTLPGWCLATKVNRRVTYQIWDDLRKSSCVYFYGGTMFSTQWFRSTFIPIFLTSVLLRILGKPVFFGPQQYGPMSQLQAQCIKWLLKNYVTEFRSRNLACLTLLDGKASQLMCDEVYSGLKPIVKSTSSRTISEPYVLVNIRKTTFLREMNENEFSRIVELLKILYVRLDVTFKVFQMSGREFCDDASAAERLIGTTCLGKAVELCPAFDEGSKLIELAGNALGTLSMSFHGCILAMLGGCPAVPIRIGEYYSYKYLDFERYTGGQAVPVVRITGGNIESCEEDAGRVIEYFQKYQADRTLRMQMMAARNLDGWYRHVGSVGHVRDG